MTKEKLQKGRASFNLNVMIENHYVEDVDRVPEPQGTGAAP